MRSKLLGVVCSALLLPFSSALADSFTQIVAFGDSLTDDGNATFLTAGLVPGSNYAPGRFTDGTNTTPSTTGPLGVWVEQLAPKLGVSVPTPGYIPGGGGTDYAVASADTGSNNLSFISDQVALHLLTSGGASSTALYAFWGGANDIADAKNPVTAADNIFGDITGLAAKGAKNFVWLNLPPLGQTPGGLASGQSAVLNAASNAFNAEWSANVAKLQSMGIQVFGADINALFNQIGTNPSAYNFVNITTPAQGQAGIDPNTYLFWDDEHPTTAGAALIADTVYSDLVGTITPEPGTGVIVLVSVAALWIARRFSKKRIER